MVQFSFNAQGIEPRYSGGGGLSVGLHMVVLSGSDWQKTSSGTGDMLVMTMTAIDGPEKGMTQTDRLNVNNPNPQATKIAISQLAAYCAVCGKGGIQQDVAELYNVPFVLEIAPQRETEQTKGKGYTEVRAIYHANGAKPGQPQSADPSKVPGQAPMGGPQPGGAFGAHPMGGAQPFAPGGQPQPVGSMGGFGGQPAFQPAGPAGPGPGGFAPQGGGQGGQPMPFQPGGPAPGGGMPAAFPGGPAPGGFAPQGGQGFAPQPQGGQPQTFQPGMQYAPAGAQGGAAPWGAR